MCSRLQQLVDRFSQADDLATGVRVLLLAHERGDIWEHVNNVAQEARTLAERFGLDAELANQAALLHDVAWIFPVAEMVKRAHEFKLEVIPEEAQHPMLVHQKLSAVLAREVFRVKQPAVLGAIEHHTTLRAEPSELDMVVFLADKLALFENPDPPYKPELLAHLGTSLEQGAAFMVNHVWERARGYPVAHPWLREAQRYFSTIG